MNTSLRKSLHLTRELVEARYPEPILNLSQSMGELSEAQIEASLRETLDNQGNEDLWLFGYGSLMWKPDFEYGERHVARVRGYHRSFCLWQHRYRGNRLNPNLMLALDAGGSCYGLAPRAGRQRLSAAMGNGSDAAWPGHGGDFRCQPGQCRALYRAFAR